MHIIPVVDMPMLHEARSGKRRAHPIGNRWESLFADRFVWLLAKPS